MFTNYLRSIKLKFTINICNVKNFPAYPITSPYSTSHNSPKLIPLSLPLYPINFSTSSHFLKFPLVPLVLSSLTFAPPHSLLLPKSSPITSPHFIYSSSPQFPSLHFSCLTFSSLLQLLLHPFPYVSYFLSLVITSPHSPALTPLSFPLYPITSSTFSHYQ